MRAGDLADRARAVRVLYLAALGAGLVDVYEPQSGRLVTTGLVFGQPVAVVAVAPAAGIGAWQGPGAQSPAVVEVRFEARRRPHGRPGWEYVVAEKMGPR